MLISTKGRYALRVMIDLAQNKESGHVAMKIVAARQGISLKYLERILPVLTKNGLIEGVHGKGGGYRLCREPKEYKVGEILRLTEGNLAPVSCLERNAPVCERKDQCHTIGMWTDFHKMINDYFDGITLEDLMHRNTELSEDEK